MMLLFLGSWLAQAAIEIQGDSTCPTPAEVGQSLTRLVPADQTRQTAARLARVSSGNGLIHVELLGPQGEPKAERWLERKASCADLGEAVAVVLAAWMGRYNPALDTNTTPLPRPAEKAAEGASDQKMEFDVGLAGVLSMVGGKPAWGGRLEGVMFPFEIPLGLDAWLSMTSSRHERISSPEVTATWMRPTFALGPVWRLRSGPFRFDLGGHALVSALRVQGEELPQVSSDTVLQLGLAAGARSLWVWKLAALWLGGNMLVFPGQESLAIRGYGEVGRLPHLEWQFALGVSLGR
jgi:hypothetical protein